MFDEADLERAAKHLAAVKHISFEAALIITKDAMKKYEIHKVFAEMLIHEPSGSHIQMTGNNFLEN